MSLKFTLDGSEIAPPQNWKELEVELNFDNNTNRLTTSDFEFLGGTADFINNWVDGGLTGEVGLLEPPVFRIDELCEAGTFNLLESVLDLRKAEFACDWTKTPIQELGNIDFLTEAADTFSLLLLIEGLESDEIGYISPEELSEVFYVTLDVPDYAQISLLSLTAFGLIDEAITATTSLIDAIAAAVGGVSGLLESIIQIIIGLIRVSLVIIQAEILIKQINAAFIPEPRKHKALKARVGFEKGCAYLGYKFSSTILDSDDYKNLCVIPKKTTQGVDVNIPKIINDQEATGQETFGDWIRDLSEVFNAKITIIGDTVHWERWDYFKEQSTYQVKDVLKEFNGTNADEIDYNYVLSYQTDSADLQTFQQFDDAIFSHTVIPLVTNVNGTTSPIANANTKNRILMSNTNDKQLKYGIVGRRDECSNSLEQTVEAITAFVDSMGINIDSQTTGYVGEETAEVYFNTKGEIIQNPDYTGAASNCRLGFMEIATDYIGVKRLCLLDGENENLISANNDLNLSAKYIFYNFHYINSPVPILENSEGNQWITYKGIETPFTCQDFAEIKEQGHNYIKMNYKGNILDAKIDSLKFNPFNCTAKIDLRIQKRWTTNLTFKDTEPKIALIRDRYLDLFNSVDSATQNSDVNS
tara:strand:+ start:198 stop:2123 length:1926 start_codon:yes stop_codon:yes gene_type:complete